jgi:oxygen-independent coproporphyrinogen-3 oxidase
MFFNYSKLGGIMRNNTLCCTNVDTINAFIQKEGQRRQSNKVLHCHPSPLYWKPMPERMETYLSRMAISETPRYVNFYMGIPFCLPTEPVRCGFCLFPTQVYKGHRSILDYLAVLKEEAKLYKPYYQNDSLSSIYVGGGTPNLLQANQYDGLMGIAYHLYGGLPSDIEITIEGIPQLFSTEKLEAIKAVGGTRISMGVQQLNDELIVHSGRKQNASQVFNTISECHRLDLECSVDLIFGWPGQNSKQMLQDLKDIVDCGVRHITHYELNIAGRSDFATKRRRLLPSLEKTREMYALSAEFLKSQGYIQRTLYDWEKTGEANSGKTSTYLYEDNMRNFIHADEFGIKKTNSMCGIGYAAVSHNFYTTMGRLMGVATMSHRNLSDYYHQVLDGTFPIDRGFVFNESDVKISWLFQSLQEMYINLDDYQKIFNDSIYKDCGVILQILQEKGWLNFNGSRIELAAEAQPQIPMLQALLSLKRCEQLRKTKREALYA